MSHQWWIQEFPEDGAPTPKADVKNYYLVIFFPKNCMKLKEFGPPRGHASLAPLDPPMHSAIFLYLCVYLKCVIE